MLIGAVMYAKDLDRLVEFYAKIGFASRVVGKTHVVLTHGASELTIIQSPRVIAADTLINYPPDMRTLTAIKLVFEVESIEITANIINENSGRIDRGQARWMFGEFLVQDAVDPEGNILQLRERAV